MLYKEFLDKLTFDKAEILANTKGTLVSDPPPGGIVRLPAPPFLMVDRIVSLEKGGRRGKIVGEQDILLDQWFFQCHFENDPVQPGCLGVDAIWQLLGFYCTSCGATGQGRALGCGEVDFFGQIRPHNQVVRYEVDIRRFTKMEDKGVCLVVGNAKVLVDGETIYTIKDAKVGTFHGIAYDNYPSTDSQNAIGGVMEPVTAKPSHSKEP